MEAWKRWVIKHSIYSLERFCSETTGSHRICESLRPPGKKLRTSYMMSSFPLIFVVADHLYRQNQPESFKPVLLEVLRIRLDPSFAI